MARNTPHPATLAAQALGWIDQATGAVVLPMHTATTFLRDPDNQYRRGRSYGRADNAGYDQPQALITALEGGAASLLFASGMAAATAVFHSLPRGRPCRRAAESCIWACAAGSTRYAADGRLAADFVDATSLDALRAAVRPGQTRLVWIETPANPLWSITDIAGAAEIAHRAGALLAVDSTAATPVLTRPLALGADIVMHSATKYLNGHSDVIAGTLTTARKDEFWAAPRRGAQRRRRDPRQLRGLSAAARHAHAVSRGSSAPAARRSRSPRRLSAHPQVLAVLYPGLPSHPGHAVAARQMQGGFGGMLSIRVKGGEAAAIATAARVEFWKRATSLGGVESLIEHRASIEGAGSPVPPDLLRLSVGIEDPGDLIADLETALG